MKSSNFSACFLFLSLLATLVFLKDPMYFGKVINDSLLIELIENDSSKGSSNSSTCNNLFSRRVLIGVGIVTSEAFSFTEFRLNSSCTVDDMNFRSQDKHVKLSSKFNSLLSHEMSSLIQNSMQVSTIGTRHLWRPHGKGVGEFWNLSHVCGFYCF